MPNNPPADTDLNSNGIGTTNYCGASSSLKVAAINPAFAVDKQVQGNLDAAPIGAGGIGNISPTGGAATYTLSFTNTGAANLDNPVMYDLLPRVGRHRGQLHQGARVAVPRGPDGPRRAAHQRDGAVLHGRQPVPSRGASSNSGCVNDWSSTPPSPLSGTTALRFAYDGTVFVAGDPGTTKFSITYTVSTPPTSVGNVAWNSVGTTVYSGATPLATAESSYTGMQATQTQPQIVKTATTASYSAVGGTVSYTFQVTNNTAVPLTGVSVTDAITDGAAGTTAPTVTCVSRTTPSATCSGASTTLAPGQVANFVASYTVTQGDLDYGHITDRATATGTPPTGGALTNASNTVVRCPQRQTPAMTIVKSVSPTSVSAAGQSVTWHFLVTNTGNTKLTQVAPQEQSFTGTGAISAISCPSATLAAGSSMDCTATYQVSQTDIDAGSVTNAATATGVGPAGQNVSAAQSTAVLGVTAAAGLTLTKTASPTTVTSAGQTVSFRYDVLNSGNVTVSGVAIHEQSFTGSGTLSDPNATCPTAPLAVGAHMICTANYTVTQADLDSGGFSNTAIATGTGAGGHPVSSPSSKATVTATQAPALTMTKTSNPTSVTTAGQTVIYSFLVHNVGNVTLTGATINEGTFTGSAGPLAQPSCPSTVLAPTQTLTCTTPYTVTQADIDAGSFTNNATASMKDPSGATVTTASSKAVVTVAQVPGLTVTKTATPSTVTAAGQVVQYSFAVGNTGNVTVSGIQINETAFSGSGTLSSVTCLATTLEPNNSTTCLATYTVTQADVDRGSIVNTAVATGTVPGGASTTSPASTATVNVTPSPALAITKTANPTTVDHAGQSVGYQFDVVNSGNVTVSGIVVLENSFSGSGTPGSVFCPATTLAPGDDTGAPRATR